MYMKIEQLYKEYGGDVFRYSMFKLKNKEDAEDVLSETFARLIDKDFDGIENMKAWIITVARNIIYEKYRKIAKSASETIDEEIEEITEGEVNLEKEILDQESIEFIKKELEGLDEETQEIIILKVWEELKFSEIAKLMNEKESTVKLRYYRGLESLKNNLNKEGRKMKVFAIPLLIYGIGELSKEPIYLIEKSTFASMASAANIDKLIINNNQMKNIIMSKLGPIMATTHAKLIIAVLIIGIMAITGGTIVLLNKPPVKQDTPEISIVSAPVEENPNTDSNDEWLFYRNENLQFEISHPRDFSIVESLADCIQIKNKDVGLVIGDNTTPACNRSGFGAGELKYENYGITLNNGINLRGTKTLYYPLIDPQNGIIGETPEEVFYSLSYVGRTVKLSVIQFTIRTENGTVDKYLPLIEKMLKTLNPYEVELIETKYTNTAYGYEVPLPEGWVTRCGAAHCGNQPAHPEEDMPSLAKANTETGMPYVTLSVGTYMIKNTWQEKKEEFKSYGGPAIYSELKIGDYDVASFESMQSPNENTVYFTKSYIFENPTKPGTLISFSTYDTADKANQETFIEIIKSLRFI